MNNMVDMNTEVLKLPLGFIRLVEFPMIFIAFVSMSGWKISFTFTPNCTGMPPKQYQVDTFKLDNVMVMSNSCSSSSTPEVPLWGEGYGSSSGFFIFTAVVSLLFVLAVLAIYLLRWESYTSDNRFPLLDFLITAVLTGCWFIATIFWWSGANGVGHLTDSTSIQTQLTFHDAGCGPPKSNNCQVTVNGGHGGLAISVLAGWACIVLFAANCWFVYKETIWFRNREPPQGYADMQNTTYASPSEQGPRQPYQR